MHPKADTACKMHRPGKIATPLNCGAVETPDAKRFRKHEKGGPKAAFQYIQNAMPRKRYGLRPLPPCRVSVSPEI